MKRFLFICLFLFNTAGYAASFHTDVAIADLAVGDRVTACNAEQCTSAPVVKKIVARDVGALNRAVAAARRLAVPGMALVVITSMPTADGGPIAAAVCAVTCEIISNMGCGAGAWITGAMNPAVGIAYAAVCTALAGGSVASCATVCAGLPTP